MLAMPQPQDAFELTLDEELENLRGSLTTMLEDFIQNSIGDSLDLSSLVGFCFAANFGAAIARYSPTKSCSFTNNEYGRASARTVRTADNRAWVVIDVADFVSAIKTEGRVYCALHTLHHELAHVHEYHVTPSHDKLLPDLEPPRNLLYPLAQGAWSEYFADYVAAPSAPADHYHVFTEGIADALPKVRDAFKVAIDQHNAEPDARRLFAAVGLHLDLLLSFTAYSLGHIARHGLTVADLTHPSAEQLRQSPFGPVWVEFEVKLRQLLATFPGGWSNDNLDVFLDLELAVEHLFEMFGLSFYFDLGGCRFNTHEPAF